VHEHGLVNGCLSVLWNAALLLRGADVLVIATSLRHLMRALGSFLPHGTWLSLPSEKACVGSW
jgi:hypothetical protein